MYTVYVPYAKLVYSLYYQHNLLRSNNPCTAVLNSIWIHFMLLRALFMVFIPNTTLIHAITDTVMATSV